MQPQARANAGAQTSTGRSQINATYVLNHMNDFSRDFKRPVSKTTTPHPFLRIAPMVYDVDYTVIHDSPQWIGDERQLRKPKVTTEQRQSQRELSNVVRHTNNLANSFMKLETGLLNLRFDKQGSAPLIRQLAAGQRIALRIYVQNEITKQATDLGLVKLGECETLAIRDMVKSMVDRRRTITQAEGNVFADEIFENEFDFDNGDESGEAHIEPYLKRSEEIRNEISNQIWNLQFDRTFARTMSHLLPLNYDSWKEKIITPTSIRKRRRMRRIKRVESVGG
uniref:MAT1-2-4 n=1 Tax=Sclerotinia minor TaxID=38451 RepID=A0A0A0P3V6_9HELO|nr:MAT1-2-4 [Sclerotinia minor]